MCETRQIFNFHHWRYDSCKKRLTNRGHEAMDIAIVQFSLIHTLRLQGAYRFTTKGEQLGSHKSFSNLTDQVQPSDWLYLSLKFLSQIKKWQDWNASDNDFWKEFTKTTKRLYHPIPGNCNLQLISSKTLRDFRNFFMLHTPREGICHLHMQSPCFPGLSRIGRWNIKPKLSSFCIVENQSKTSKLASRI